VEEVVCTQKARPYFQRSVWDDPRESHSWTGADVCKKDTYYRGLMLRPLNSGTEPGLRLIQN